ncbi:SDR family NAD(P)-dependent oxidoreductase [Streptomyces sp. NPDC057798]|uniref:SDR family NAD(P)-dependent oxidoreductase n=1 Tax=Streptomyces sp. NPDC057798 TaxID=3346252 RepID=UPI0036CB3C5E
MARLWTAASSSRGRSGQVAVVTGAGRGIGCAVAAELDTRGYRLVLGDIDGDAAQHTASSLSDAVGVSADMCDPVAVAGLSRTALDRFGRIDVWVNNAGLVPDGLLQLQSIQLLHRLVQVNLEGVLYGCREALLVMAEQGSGHVVNVASMCASKPLAGLAAYSATKAAVVALSEALRRETRQMGAVEVSAVLPYLVDTQAGRGLRPVLVRPRTSQEVARAVAGVLRRPRAHVYVPGHLRWGLSCLALLPQPLRDIVDDTLDTDRIAMAVNHAARASYREDLARWYLDQSPGSGDIVRPARVGGTGASKDRGAPA